MHHSNFHPCVPRHGLSAVLAASLLCPLGAVADTTLTVQASPELAATGVKGYEPTTIEDTADACYFLQVVGKASAAGSICVTTDGSTTTATVTANWPAASLVVVLSGHGEFAVLRDGVEVASLRPGPLDENGIPIGGMPIGLDELSGDPAWRVLMAAADDSNLRAHLDSHHPLAATPCDDACANEWPMPNDCDGPWDEYVCCITEANYDFCRRYCGCDSLSEPLATACKAGAAALLLFEETVCVKRFLTAG